MACLETDVVIGAWNPVLRSRWGCRTNPNTNPLSRIWCMYEVWQTVISSQPLVVRIGGMTAQASSEKGGLARDPKCRLFLEEWRKETVERLTRKASVVAAESGWPEDKAEIIAAIRASDGGTKAVDKTIVSGLGAAYGPRHDSSAMTHLPEGLQR